MNNPVQVAVNELKSIWGEQVPYNIILSIGSRYANKPAIGPSA
jgi:hypothetical protein